MRRTPNAGATFGRQTNRLIYLGGLQGPTVARSAPNKLGGFGSICGSHVRAIPFELLANAQGHTTQEDDLGEVRSDVEIGISWATAFAGRNPLQMMAVIGVAFVFVKVN